MELCLLSVIAAMGTHELTTNLRQGRTAGFGHTVLGEQDIWEGGAKDRRSIQDVPTSSPNLPAVREKNSHTH